MSETVFSTALQVLDRYGWYQGGYGSVTVGFCYLGAARFKARCGDMSDATEDLASNYAHRAAAALDPDHTWPGWDGTEIRDFFNVAIYNDDSRTTEEDIKRLLKEADVMYREEHQYDLALLPS